MPVGVLLNDIDEKVVVVPALKKSTVSVPEAEYPLSWSSVDSTLSIYLFFFYFFFSLLFFPEEIQSLSWHLELGL